MESFSKRRYRAVEDVGKTGEDLVGPKRMRHACQRIAGREEQEVGHDDKRKEESKSGPHVGGWREDD